jgi:hypothetical protein
MAILLGNDELDEPSGSHAPTISTPLQKYRAETTRFVQHCLGFHDASNDLDPKPSHIPSSKAFGQSPGEAFARIYDFGERYPRQKKVNGHCLLTYFLLQSSANAWVREETV